jgi:ribokinase
MAPGESVVPKVVVVGAAFVDASFRLEREPQADKTEYSRESTLGAGGKGLNQAIAASELGASVSLITTIGDDIAAGYVTSALSDSGVVALDTSPSGNTPIVAVLVRDQVVRMVATPDAGRRMVDRATVAALSSQILAADILLLTLDFPMATVMAVLDVVRTARSAGKGPLVVLNPAPAVSPGDITSSVLLDVDWLVPNMWEAKCILGRQDRSDPMEDLVKRLGAIGASAVCLTNGERGSAYASDMATGTPDSWVVKRCKAIPVVTVDPTGASDAFCATFALSLFSGSTKERAVARATAAGAMTSEAFGTSSSTKRLSELDAFLRRRTLRYGPRA